MYEAVFYYTVVELVLYSFLTCCCHQTPHKMQLKRGRVYCGSQIKGTAYPGGQGVVAVAAHRAPPVRKQRERNAAARFLLSIQSMTPVHSMVLAALRVHLPSSRKIPHKHTQRGVSQETQDLVMVTTKASYCRLVFNP